MVRKYLASLLFKGAGAVAGVLTNILIARKIPLDDAGVVFYAIAFSQFMAIVCRCGLDVLSLRTISALLAKPTETESPKLFLYNALSVTLILGVPVTALSLFISGFSKAGAIAPIEVMTIVGVAVLATALTNISAESLKGLGYTTSAIFWQTFSQPGMLLLGTFFVTSELGSLSVLVAASFLVTAFFSVTSVVLATSNDGGEWRFDWREIKRLLILGGPFLIIAVTNGVVDISDTILLGFLGSARDVGIYYACAKLAAVSTTILFLINSFVAPRISGLSARQNSAEIFRLVDRLNIWMIGGAALLCIFMFLTKRILLGFFGAEYAEHGQFALQVLSIGYFSVLAAGPVGVFMTMTGRQSLYVRANILACAVNISINIVLIPMYGLNGACFGTAVSLVVKNLFLVVRYRKYRSEVNSVE